MKTFAIASLALASVASAQLDNIPKCALACFLGPLGSDGCSTITDFKCHCQKGSSLLSSVQPCVQGACGASDQAATIAAVQKTCQDAGVPIEIPNASGAVSAASSAIASATSAAASAQVPTLAPQDSSVPAAIPSILSSIVSSVASAASSAVSNATKSVVSPTPTSSVVQATGGAAMATQAAGLLGAAALAMLAL